MDIWAPDFMVDFLLHKNNRRVVVFDLSDSSKLGTARRLNSQDHEVLEKNKHLLPLSHLWVRIQTALGKLSEYFIRRKKNWFIGSFCKKVSSGQTSS